MNEDKETDDNKDSGKDVKALVKQIYISVYDIF